MLACFVLFAREAVGAGQGTRHSLRPLSSRVIVKNNSGASRRGNHCGCLESEWLTKSSAGGDLFNRHARACRGHPRLASGNASRTWIAETRPGHDGAERITSDFGSSRERRSIHLVMPALVAGVDALLHATLQERG